MGLARAGLLLAILLVWQFAVWAGAPEFLLGPWQVLRHFAEALGTRELYVNAAASLARALPGFLLGSVAGIALGLAAGTSRAFDQVFSPAVFLSYPVPKIVMLPLFMLWFGIGEASKVLVIALACFYPLFINAYYGVRATPRTLVWSGQNLGAGRTRIFWRVVLPAALPQIFAGLRVSLALSFIVMFAAEMINARSGLGQMIRIAENSLRFDLMYVSLISIAILGYAADWLLRLARHRLLGWQERPRVSRLRPLLLILPLLVAWEFASRSGLWSPLLFPPLLKIFHELEAFVLNGDALMEAGISLYRALAGFGLAAALGVPLGMVMGRSRFVGDLLDPLFSGTYAVPKLALFPIFVFALGIGSLSKVALIFLECLYPIVIVTSQGARGVNRVLLWSAANLGASSAAALGRVVVPATAPFIFAGFRVALPIALIVVIITEMVSSADGLGYLVIYSLSSLKTDRMLAVVVVIAALGWALDRALVFLRDRLIYWEKLETYYV